MKFQSSSVSYQKLVQINKEFERSRNIEYEVIRNNDWLQDYFGWTYSEQLHQTLARGLFEEHSKKADVGMAGIEKALVFCLDPHTLEIQKNGVAGSSLLREKKSGKIWESILQRTMIKKRKVIGDLILDNFGLWFAALVVSGAPVTVSLTNDGGTASTIRINADGTSLTTFNCADAIGGAYRTYIKLGSGVTAPARADNKIQTSLGNAPESGYLGTIAGGYTASNTIIYQADANPTGGSGTVNEIGDFWDMINTGGTNNKIMKAHDVLNFGLPVAVAYTAGKLLRGAFTWQI